MVKRTIIAVAAFVLFFTQVFAAEAKKNVIFVIADGGGPALMGLLMQYARFAPNSSYKGRVSNMEQLFNGGLTGIVFTTPAKTIVTDSAAAGTQLATGAVTYPYATGVDESGRPVKSLLEKAKKEGLSTGLITDVYVTDATPAVFVAHEPKRGDYGPIALDMLRTKPDVVLGGGLNYFISRNNLRDAKYQNVFEKISYASELEPKLSDDGVFEKLLKSGYQLVFDKKTLQSAKGKNLFGLFAPSNIPFNSDYKPSDPTLKDMAQKAIEILSQNDKGFFLMLEAGLLDWAAHAHDHGAVLQELLELDEVLGWLMQFAKDNPDTLIILTADHDTGGFGFAYRKTDGADEFQQKISASAVYGNEDFIPKANFDIIAAQKKSFYELEKIYAKLPQKDKTPEKIQKLFKDNTGVELPLGFIEKTEDFNAFKEEIGKRLGVVWSTGNHTASPVFLALYGANGGLRGGVMSGAELNKQIEAFLYAK